MFWCWAKTSRTQSATEYRPPRFQCQFCSNGWRLPATAEREYASWQPGHHWPAAPYWLSADDANIDTDRYFVGYDLLTAGVSRHYEIVMDSGPFWGEPESLGYGIKTDAPCQWQVFRLLVLACMTCTVMHIRMVLDQGVDD